MPMHSNKFRTQSNDLVRAIAQRVLERRKELGLSARQVAEAAGITERQLRALAHGGSPKLTTLLGLAEALQVSLVDLVSRGGLDASRG